MSIISNESMNNYDDLLLGIYLVQIKYVSLLTLWVDEPDQKMSVENSNIGDNNNKENNQNVKLNWALDSSVVLNIDQLLRYVVLYQNLKDYEEYSIYFENKGLLLFSLLLIFINFF